MDPKYKDRLEALGLHFGIKINESNLKNLEKIKSQELFGITANNSLGNFFYREQVFPDDYVHGETKFSNLNQKLSIFTHRGNFKLLKLEKCIFIDTETTGLSLSGGTFAFMIGIGYFFQKKFHLRQYFLKEGTQEDAMLLDFLNFIEEFQTLISYNGNSFDLPIIKARLRYHRIPNKILEIEHLDLLKYARMFFRFQFSDRSLKNIEMKVLNYQRTEEEIPGYLAPIIYQEYIKTNAIHQIEGVFYHNAMDIVSLAALLDITNEISCKNNELFNKFDTLNYSIAKQLEKNKIFELALNSYKTSIEQANIPKDIMVNCLLSIAKIYKRNEQIDIAIPYWEKAIEYQNIEAHIELAKAYEHKLKDFEKALNYCKKALFILEKDIEFIKNKKLIDECNHRLARLLSKVNI